MLNGVGPFADVTIEVFKEGRRRVRERDQVFEQFFPAAKVNGMGVG